MFWGAILTVFCVDIYSFLRVKSQNDECRSVGEWKFLEYLCTHFSTYLPNIRLSGFQQPENLIIKMLDRWKVPILFTFLHLRHNLSFSEWMVSTLTPAKLSPKHKILSWGKWILSLNISKIISTCVKCDERSEEQIQHEVFNESSDNHLLGDKT